MTNKRTAFQDLAAGAAGGVAEDLAAPRGRLRVPTVPERALILLGNIRSKEDFSRKEHAEARKQTLDAMAAEIVSRSDLGASHRTDQPSIPIDEDIKSLDELAAKLEQLALARHSDEELARMAMPLKKQLSAHYEASRWVESRHGPVAAALPKLSVAHASVMRALHRAEMPGDITDAQSAAQPPRRRRAVLRKCALAVAIIVVAGLSVLGAVTLARMSLGASGTAAFSVPERR